MLNGASNAGGDGGGDGGNEGGGGPGGGELSQNHVNYQKRNRYKKKK